jgi:hypothetical protein
MKPLTRSRQQGNRHIGLTLPVTSPPIDLRVQFDRTQNMAETPAMAGKINNLEDIHCVRDAGVAGSNPATPTSNIKRLDKPGTRTAYGT